MNTPLRSLRIAGFRSIEDLTLELTSGVTMLIGANGSGKSNIVDAFELLGTTVDRRLQRYVALSGGFDSMLHRSRTGESADRVVLRATGETSSGGWQNGYQAVLLPAADDSAVVDETTYTHQTKTHAKPYENRLGTAQESRLASQAEQSHVSNVYLHNLLSDCRVFHFDDTSSDAPPLRRTGTADNLTLHSDARNIAALLMSMRDNEPVCYDRVVRSVRAVAPFFDDFVLEPEGESVRLRWRESGLDGVFSGSAFSSGTLRFICLATLLQQPDPPQVIVLDEPELGLHPAAIEQLAELMRLVGQDRRILAATQSVTLLSRFSVDEVAVVERVDGKTTAARPDAAELSAWLEEYSLGELWEMNVLGGRPRPSTAWRRTA